MDALFEDEEKAVPERSLAALHGAAALVVGAAAWSGMAAVFGGWALLATPGLGWMVAWSCRYGGRALDTRVRLIGWLLSVAAVLAGLAALSVFSVLQGSPDAGLRLREVASTGWSLFAEPPWFGSAAVLLALPGAARALRPTSPGAARSQTAVPDDARPTPGAAAEPRRLRPVTALPAGRRSGESTRTSRVA